MQFILTVGGINCAFEVPDYAFMADNQANGLQKMDSGVAQFTKEGLMLFVPYFNPMNPSEIFFSVLSVSGKEIGEHYLAKLWEVLDKDDFLSNEQTKVQFQDFLAMRNRSNSNFEVTAADNVSINKTIN